ESSSAAVGKLAEQREERRPRDDTNGRRHKNAALRPGPQFGSSLQPATRGSLSLDLASAVDITLTSTKPVRVSAGTFAPVLVNGRPVGGLILGQSLATLLGLFVLPGVIDADYKGEIMVMVHTLAPPLTLPAGQRFAQFIPLVQHTEKIPPREDRERDDTGFGSCGGLVLLSLDLSKRPKQVVVITYKGEQLSCHALLDTGVDASIINSNCYPSHWPLFEAVATVSGVGGVSLAKRTPMMTIYIDEKQMTAVFSVITLPQGVECLIGRDILSQLGMRL
ncbi:POK9 protein, partial [Odontophorus gujanensis]|nr:POK9 protein [Odontophorus gujanensis]